MQKMFKVLGSPTPAIWSDLVHHRFYVERGVNTWPVVPPGAPLLRYSRKGGWFCSFFRIPNFNFFILYFFAGFHYTCAFFFERFEMLGFFLRQTPGGRGSPSPLDQRPIFFEKHFRKNSLGPYFWVPLGGGVPVPCVVGSHPDPSGLSKKPGSDICPIPLVCFFWHFSVSLNFFLSFWKHFFLSFPYLGLMLKYVCDFLFSFERNHSHPPFTEKIRRSWIYSWSASHMTHWSASRPGLDMRKSKRPKHVHD